MRRAAAIILPPLAALLIAIGAWGAYVRVYDVPRFLLPSPFEVAQAVLRDPTKLLQAMISTGMAAVAALATSMVCGVLTGFIFAQSTWLRRSLYPYAVFLQTVPIIAIAPLIVVLLVMAAMSGTLLRWARKQGWW